MENNIKYRDGHIHSPLCPHGSKDSFDSYVEKAIKLGLKEISFTEHMPLPGYFMDDKVFLDECAMKEDKVEKYFKEIDTVKEKYKGKIKINRGFEVDYIEGYEEKTKKLLEKYGSYLEDSIISVHFVKIGENLYTDIDGIEGFKRAIKVLGSLEKVYDKYYETLLKVTNYDLGNYKPKRIGHPNLIRKFNKLYPLQYKNNKLLEEIVISIKDKGYEVDYNMSGLRKENCREEYISGAFKEFVEMYGIKKVYGSDAHESRDVGYNFK